MGDEAVLERILNGDEEPTYLQFALLQRITNDFSEERKIGRGGYGKVYKGVYNGEEIAVKKFYDLPAPENKQFENECVNLLRIRHPNIVQLLGYCYETQSKHVEHKGELRFSQYIYRILCFEYLQGGSLDKYLNESHDHDWPTRYNIIEGTCEGLNFLHGGCGSQILHLDLKPANILLDKYMGAKVADFGLSRFFSKTHTHITNTTIGTEDYIPPEFRFKNQISSKNDVYSLGIIIIEIMAGRVGYSKFREMDDVKPFVEQVITNWREWINATTSPFPSAELDQVETCIKIAIECVHPERNNRPTVAKILATLQETEKRFLEEWRNHAGFLVGQSLPTPTKSGSRGGSGGKVVDIKEDPWRLHSLTISYQGLIDAFSFSYIDQSGKKQRVGPWGEECSYHKTETIRFSPSEFVEEVRGAYGSHFENILVTCLTFVTNIRTYGPFGNSHHQNVAATPFSFMADKGSSIVGFHGRSGSHLFSIGVYMSLPTPNKSGPRGGSGGKIVDEVGLMVVYEPTKPQENGKSREDPNMPAEEVPEAKRRKIVEPPSGKGKLGSSEKGKDASKNIDSSAQGQCAQQTEQRNLHPPQSFSCHYPTNKTYLGEGSRAMDVARGAMGSLLDKLGKLVIEDYNLERSMKRDIQPFLEDLAIIHKDLPQLENGKSREGPNMAAEEVPEAERRKIFEPPSGKGKLGNSQEGKAASMNIDSSAQGQCAQQTEQRKFYPPQSFSRHYPTNTTYLGKGSRAVDVARGAMGSLLDKLGKLITEDYNLERSMKRDIESFSEDLAKIHKDLPNLKKLDAMEIWVNKVRELSYKIEDKVDSFVVRVEPDSSRSGFRELPHEGLKFLGNDMTIHCRIDDVIKDMKSQVQDVVDMQNKFNFDVNNVVANATAKAPIDRRMATYINEEQLIGIESRIDQLIRLLDVSKQELKIVFIVGLGGLGKTTLAKAVYGKLKAQYHSRAFVPVGQNPDLKKVLIDILVAVGCNLDVSKLEVGQVRDELEKFLEDKRYFIVLDDIWDSEACALITSAVLKNNHGSRVITTTRIEPIVRACCERERKYVYKMKPLSEEDSRRLFLRRIFGRGKDCPDTPRKEEISKYILKKCGGMPLAINSIASLLADEEESTWEYIWKSLGSMTEGDDFENMKQILDLSYIHLPDHLKTCLLYVCMYPEDREIDKNDLLRLWVAEGFVNAKSGPDAEDVAKRYFDDLISMNMIQPGERDAYNNEVLSCRVHDIMLDLLRSKSSEENFICVIDGSKYGTGKIRRVSFHNNDKNYMRIFETINKESLSQVRSVLLCRSSLAAYFLEKFKYVRVLHLERDNGFHSSLDLTGISKLFLLRYLKIACPHGGTTDTCEMKLPNQIGELQQLETIDIQGCYMEKYPSDIVSLPWLSHLSMTRIIAGVVLPDGIDRLTSLRTLAGVRLYESSVDNILGLGKLTNLRKLEICLYTERGEAITARHMDALRSSISILSTSLMICTFRERFPLKYVLGWSSRTLFPGDSQIRELHLGGCIFRRCPKWIRQLHKLYKLSIWVREVADGISIVAGLRSLAYISLKTCNIWAKGKEERQICVWEEGKEERVVIPGTGSEAFQALKEFIFCCQNASLTFEAGAMPKLERLEIMFRYPQFLPVDIQHLPAPTLKQICLRVAHNDMEVEVSQDWNSDDEEDLRQHNRTVRALLIGAFKTHYPGADIVIHFEEGVDEEEDDENEDSEGIDDDEDDEEDEDVEDDTEDEDDEDDEEDEDVEDDAEDEDDEDDEEDDE